MTREGSQKRAAPALLLVVTILLEARRPRRLAAHLHAPEVLPVDGPAELGAWMVKGVGGVGGCGGGGSLEHLRQWLGAQWAGLSLGVPSCPELPGAP